MDSEFALTAGSLFALEEAAGRSGKNRLEDRFNCKLQNVCMILLLSSTIMQLCNFVYACSQGITT